MDGDNLKSSTGRKAVSGCATVDQISLSRCRMSLILIPRNRRNTANKNKIIFLTVKGVHLEMIYHYQCLWLATSVSHHLWAGFSALDAHAPDSWASFHFNNIFETFQIIFFVHLMSWKCFQGTAAKCWRNKVWVGSTWLGLYLLIKNLFL